MTSSETGPATDRSATVAEATSVYDACAGMTIMPRSNDPGVRLRDLRILEVMLGELSLTRAAERLATSQPTISKVLARLRGQFHDPLLVRDGQAMRPTPRAQELVAPL